MSAQTIRAVDRSKYYLRWEPLWERGFATLCKFRCARGHSCPSRRHVEGKFKLGNWVAIQRYHKDLLSVQRKRRLDAIGFVWDWRGTTFGNKTLRLF